MIWTNKRITCWDEKSGKRQEDDDNSMTKEESQTMKLAYFIDSLLTPFKTL